MINETNQVSKEGCDANTVVLLDRMLKGLCTAQPLAPLEHLRANLTESYSHVVQQASVRILLGSIAGTWCAEVELLCGDQEHTTCVPIDPEEETLEYSTKGVLQVAKRVQSAGPLLSRVRGAPLTLVDRIIDSAQGVETAVLFALSFTALRARAHIAHQPAWLYLHERVHPGAGLPTATPAPIVTIFEGGECNGSDLCIEEVAILVYSTSLRSALSLARRVSESVREETSGGVGVRGGWVVREGGGLLPLLIALAAAVSRHEGEMDRVKVFTHFGRGGGHYMGEARVSYSVLEDCKEAAKLGILHGAIDPFNSTTGQDGWSVLRILDMMLVADTVQNVHIPLDGHVIDPKQHATVSKLVQAAQPQPKKPASLTFVRGSVAESSDPFIVHCALALQHDFLMLGGLHSGDRTACWNELLRAEDYLTDQGVQPYIPVPSAWV